MQPTKIGKLHSAILCGLTLFRTKTLHQIDGCRQPAPLNSIPHTNGLDNVMQLCFFVFLIEMLIGFWSPLLSVTSQVFFSHPDRKQTVARFIHHLVWGGCSPRCQLCIALIRPLPNYISLGSDWFCGYRFLASLMAQVWMLINHFDISE